MNFIKKWFINFLVKKVVKMALKKADITRYMIKGADVADNYLDKYLGKPASESVQNQIVVWLNNNVSTFTNTLKRN